MTLVPSSAQSRMEAGPEGRSGWVILVVVLVVVAASSLVAVAATGAGLFVPATDLSGGWVMGVRLGGAAAAVAGLLWLPAQLRRFPSKGNRRGDPTVAAGVTAAILMGLLALIALFAPPVELGEEASGSVPSEGVRIDAEARPQGPPSTSPLSGGVSGSSSSAEPVDLDFEASESGRPSPPDRSVGGFDWGLLERLGDILLLILVLGVAAIGIPAIFNRLRHGVGAPSAEVVVVVPEAGAAPRASLDEIAFEGRTPRQKVTGAYRRLVAALTEAGAARWPQEAPHEHLHRALGPRGLRVDPMHRLTELYVLAQFSETPITERHVAAAAEALEVSLASLPAPDDAFGTSGAASAQQEADV